MLRHSIMDTPIGPFTVIVSDSGAVRASGFTSDVPALLGLVHPGLVEDVRPETDPGAVGLAVRSYFDGDLTAIDDIRVEQHSGGQFMTFAWQVMRDIKPGAPVTYTQFAALAGRPAAVRAAAAACARNPAALFVPCHRVLRTDGSLGGYRWGLEVKTWLLDHERAA
ncbi:methylated-DNA--[protein]-cysteine S-methyltransferase [Jidongwangia harbinensis]|uniref:methylated-DNA--[protein]-cysteine S-methyltransferase n=1 Tax=Jidongwangia harbinensis TaxID=2878561 RepID=UPI001CD9713A|nr:methylated-DNA--[protein]-cysteine S-methyltransferase [Jidongwangia harbinensis]MCA2218661.1 methylated-DNA--[protein]-cysteine S-methyltransferase [Jidongwangia harbinensis]